MASKILVSSFLTVLLINMITANDLISNKKCNCVHVKCKPISSKLCAFYSGKFIKQSLDAYQCNCCPFCIIYSGLNKTCKEYSKALKIKCVYGTYCSEKDGHTCKSIFGHTLNNNENENNRMIRIKISEKTVPKMSFDKITDTKINSSIAYRSVRRVTRQANKGSSQNSIGGGSANSINSNNGPTYILNNVYTNDRNNAKSGATESTLELKNNVGEFTTNNAGNDNPIGNEQDNSANGGNQDNGAADQSNPQTDNQPNSAASDDAYAPPPPARQVPEESAINPNAEPTNNNNNNNNNNRDDTNTNQEQNTPPATTDKPKTTEIVPKAVKNTPIEKVEKSLPINFVPVADNIGKTANRIEEVPVKAFKGVFGGNKPGGSTSDSEAKDPINSVPAAAANPLVNPFVDKAIKTPSFF